MAVIADFFTKKHIFYYICFIILYRLAGRIYNEDCAVISACFKRCRWVRIVLDGDWYVKWSFGSAAFVLWLFVGRYLCLQVRIEEDTFTLCCIFNLPFVAYTFLAVVQPTNVYLIGTCITMEYFGYGFGFVGLTLFMMQQIAPGKHQMSHYAFASGIMNLGVMLPGMVSGYFSDLLGYRNFFIYVLIATIPAFLITYFIPFTYDDSKNK